MKFENIVSKLKKDGYKVEVMQFFFRTVFSVSGTALADIVDEDVVHTTAKYKDVISQIEAGKSHIQTIEGHKKALTIYFKLGYKGN